MLNRNMLVCSKDFDIVGVIIDSNATLNNVTLAVLWNDYNTATGCKTFVMNCDNIMELPKGTIIKQVNTKGEYLECKYKGYDNKRHVIFDENNKHNLLVLGNETYSVIFNNDVSTKNSKQYTCLGVEPWEIMEKDFTGEEFVGFLKGNIIKYVLRRKGTDLQDAEKIEHYARKLQELLK